MSAQLPSHFTVDARGALAFLGEAFFDDDAWIHRVQEVKPEEIPDQPRRLLVHNQHMTATLKEHYQQPVALRVLAHREEGQVYRRKILLTVDQGQRIVEFGLVRLNLEFLPEYGREEVILRNRPLGEILAKYDVLTHEPRWYVRFPRGSEVVQSFGPTSSDAYGRIGTIYCDGQPAIELLEVVPA